MNFSIFPMFFSFYGTYTKIFIIFGSIHNLLHKIKHNSKTAQKEKEKLLRSEQPGNRHAGRPAYAQPTQALRARGLPLTRSLTGGSRPSVPSSSLRRGSGVRPVRR